MMREKKKKFNWILIIVLCLNFMQSVKTELGVEFIGLHEIILKIKDVSESITISYSNDNWENSVKIGI